MLALMEASWGCISDSSCLSYKSGIDDSLLCPIMAFFGIHNLALIKHYRRMFVSTVVFLSRLRDDNE